MKTTTAFPELSTEFGTGSDKDGHSQVDVFVEGTFYAASAIKGGFSRQ
jgi:hypothetical protein